MNLFIPKLTIMKKKYKTYKSLFEIFKEKSKTFYYLRKLDSCKQNTRKTWNTRKEVICKTNTFKSKILKRILIERIKTFDQNNLDSTNFCTETDPKLASLILTSCKDFNQFIDVSETVLKDYNLQDEELEEDFNSLKFNKIPELDNISLFVVNFCISGIFHTLKHNFNISLQTGVFPNGMRIA